MPPNGLGRVSELADGKTLGVGGSGLRMRYVPTVPQDRHTGRVRWTWRSPLPRMMSAARFSRTERPHFGHSQARP
jgi:hypothetical protein